MNNLEIAMACLYSLIAAVSYRRTGIIAAIFWPLTVIFFGLIVYVRVITSELPPAE